MTQAIDPGKLKAAAEHLEWVLRQYPNESVVQGLLKSLLPLIEDAKALRIDQPVAREEVPGAYNFGDGAYSLYTEPSVDDAYTKFRIELRGGLTEQEKQQIAEMEAYRQTLLEGKP